MIVTEMKPLRDPLEVPAPAAQQAELSDDELDCVVGGLDRPWGQPVTPWNSPPAPR
jgi:hypothetical protein